MFAFISRGIISYPWNFGDLYFVMMRWDELFTLPLVLTKTKKGIKYVFKDGTDLLPHSHLIQQPDY